MVVGWLLVVRCWLLVVRHSERNAAISSIGTRSISVFKLIARNNHTNTIYSDCIVVKNSSQRRFFKLLVIASKAQIFEDR